MKSILNGLINKHQKEEINMNLNNCFTCEFAHRDKHNRFEGMCSGYSNCGYRKFEGEIKPTLEECINNLRKNLNSDKDYTQGFNDALKFIEAWNEDE
jgi:hypothetical protein